MLVIQVVLHDVQALRWLSEGRKYRVLVSSAKNQKIHWGLRKSKPFFWDGLGLVKSRQRQLQYIAVGSRPAVSENWLFFEGGEGIATVTAGKASRVVG